jgi:hypothetical protein
MTQQKYSALPHTELGYLSAASTTTGHWPTRKYSAIGAAELVKTGWPLGRYRGPVSSQRVPGGVVHKLPADLRKALIANPTALDA